FLVSFALSLSTVGSNVYWQDSGLFLSAVKDLGVLYPPGFVLYLVFCKTWTLLLPFLDFTLAVHLFSSACVASTCAVLALAVRAFLRGRGGLFRAVGQPDAVLAAWAGLAAGSLAAGGFTLWFTGIYAKGYAFYYFILALLLWRMIRADEGGSPRDFTIVAVLIGLAWAAHPSSVCLAPALILFVARHRGLLGAKGIAIRTGIAAAAALGPTLLILPILSLREPATALGDPRSLPELLEYASGLRFTGRGGAFGIEAQRIASFGQLLWEEFLAVGLIFTTIGFVSLVGVNGRLLAGILAWVLPYSATAILFKVEGQHDCWLVAAWLPLHLMIGLGLYHAAAQLPAAGRAVGVCAAAAAGLFLAFIANRADLNQRHYEFASIYGRAFLDNLDPDAIVVLNGDDSLAICGYFQRVRGERSDVTIVAQPFLGLTAVSERDWYDERLLKSQPFLRMPDYGRARARFPDARPIAAHLAAFLEANAGRGRPVFTQATLPPELLPAGASLAPAGVLWKLVPREQDEVDLKYWRFPIEPQEIQGRVGRSRGLKLTRTRGTLVSRAEPYEHRLMDLLVKARYELGSVLLKGGRTREGIAVLESVRFLDPDYDAVAPFVYSLGRAYHAVGDAPHAETYLRQAVRLGIQHTPRGWALLILGEIQEKRGRLPEAKAFYAEAAASAAGDPALQQELAKKQPTK
ncbi:MAG TPA: DUF2723 domain-containing protein, partial [Planctomycetota bacterium]|nr:DUF2723 domain-containing protein [Planctomycetota bacterium]